MKTITEREWTDFKGKTQFLDEEETKIAMVSDVLLVIGNTYKPSDQLILSVGEIRKFNHAMDTLEEDPVDGKYHIEEDRFEVLEKVVNFLTLHINVFARSAGGIEDLFKED